MVPYVRAGSGRLNTCVLGLSERAILGSAAGMTASRLLEPLGRLGRAPHDPYRLEVCGLRNGADSRVDVKDPLNLRLLVGGSPGEGAQVRRDLGFALSMGVAA